MKGSIKNFLLSSGVAMAGVAAFSAISYTVTRNLMKVALNRENPKNIQREKERLSGSKKFADIFCHIEAAAKKLEDSNCEEIELISRDGIRLVGHWHESENPKRVIIAMHGWRSSWSQDFGAISDFWYDNDCSVLFAEQRGQNKSGGEYMGFGLLERYDCLDWIDWVNDRTTGKLPIYLGGVSMGATTVLMAAGSELPETVKGIVADCGFTSPGAIWKHVAKKNLHIPYGIYRDLANGMCRKRIHFGADDYSCPEALGRCTVPVMFVHGTEDSFVPIEMTYENYKACVSPKRLFVVPGAEHGMSYLTDMAGYESAIKGFWNDYDED